MAQTATSRRTRNHRRVRRGRGDSHRGGGRAAFTQEPVPGQRGRGPGRPLSDLCCPRCQSRWERLGRRDSPTRRRRSGRSIGSGDARSAAEEFRPGVRRRSRRGADEWSRRRAGRNVAPGADDLAAMLMSFDKNGDGKLTRAGSARTDAGAARSAPTADKDGALERRRIEAVRSRHSRVPSAGMGGGEGSRDGREGEGRRGGREGGEAGRSALSSPSTRTRIGAIDGRRASPAPSVRSRRSIATATGS